MKPIYIFLSVLILLPATSVYAENSTSPTTGFQEPVEEVFTWFGEFMSENIDSANLAPDTTENLHNTLDAGIEAGVTGTNLWFKVHEFFVELIFTGSTEAGIADESSKDLIVWVSMLAVFGMLIGLTIKLVKENSKIGAIVFLVLLALGIIGITVQF